MKSKPTPPSLISRAKCFRLLLLSCSPRSDRQADAAELHSELYDGMRELQFQHLFRDLISATWRLSLLFFCFVIRQYQPSTDRLMTDQERREAHQRAMQSRRHSDRVEEMEKRAEITGIQKDNDRSQRQLDRRLAEEAKLSQALAIQREDVQQLPQKLRYLLDNRIDEDNLDLQRTRHELTIQREHDSLANDENIRHRRMLLNAELIDFILRQHVLHHFGHLASESAHLQAKEIEAIKQQVSSELGVGVDQVDELIRQAVEQNLET